MAFGYLNDKETMELFFGGAAGGSKTALIAFWLARNSLRYPKTRWLMGRAQLKTLKETTLNTFFEITGAMGWSSLYRYNEQKSKITWHNGSEILLKDLAYYPSDPNFDELGSLEITGAAIDEAAQVLSRAKQIVLSRVRYKLNEYGLTPKLLLVSNPSKGYLYKEFYKPWKTGTLPKGKVFIPSLVTDNPYLPASYIDNLRTLPPADRERLLHGNFDYDDDPSALIEFDAMQDMFTNEQVGRGADKYLTCDIAGRGSDVFRIGYWEGWAMAKSYEMATSTGKQVNDRIREVKIKHGVPNSHIIYDADGVGGGVDGYFPGSLAFINGARPLNGEKYENLKTQMCYKLADKVNNREVWWAEEASTDQMDLITQELGQIKRREMDSDGNLKVVRKEQIKENIGRSPDYSDMLMMRCYFDEKKKGYQLKFIPQ